MQRYDPEKTGRLVIIFALPIKLQECVTMEANSCLQENMITTNIILCSVMTGQECVTMEANSCLQENMINDNCCIFHSYKQKLPLTQIMFNYDTDSITE